MARVSTLTEISKLDVRWRPGVWLGQMPDSDEHIVATREKLMLSRSVRAMPPTKVKLSLS
eukprot:9888769-Heterocapsa_arctica.AAC.1